MPQLHTKLPAAFALAKASLTAMLRSPTSVVFSLLFPVIFIVVFGSMVDNTIVQLKIVFTETSDTANPVYKAITNISNITIDSNLTASQAINALQKGRLTAIIGIKKDTGTSPIPHYAILLTSSTSSKDAASLLKTLLNNAIMSINQQVYPANPSSAASIARIRSSHARC